MIIRLKRLHDRRCRRRGYWFSYFDAASPAHSVESGSASTVSAAMNDSKVVGRFNTCGLTWATLVDSVLLVPGTSNVRILSSSLLAENPYLGLPILGFPSAPLMPAHSDLNDEVVAVDSAAVVV